MANPEHLEILKKGVEVWNKWREEHKGVRPDLNGADLGNANLGNANLASARLLVAILKGANLAGADLKGANLEGANLAGADCRGSKLIGANLTKANLTKVNLEYANLTGANLTKTNLENASLIRANLTNIILTSALLSGCMIDSNTKLDKIINCEKGVNGFYFKETDSSALIRLDPKGNSMTGSNAEAIVESLKYARKLHTYSLTLAGIALLGLLITIKDIPFPLLKDTKISPIQFSVLSILISTVLCALVAIFFYSSVQGVKYLSDRASVMSVAQFPWILSKYENEKWLKVFSILLRLVICFHPFIYFFVLIRSKTEDSGYLQWAIPFTNYNLLPIFSMVILCIPLFSLSGIIFYLSQLFQKPILFDPQTEKERKTDAEKIVDANEKISETNERLLQKVSELVELLKPKNGEE